MVITNPTQSMRIASLLTESINIIHLPYCRKALLPHRESTKRMVPTDFNIILLLFTLKSGPAPAQMN